MGPADAGWPVGELMRPPAAEWSGDEFDLGFPHGTPLLRDGKLQAGQRDATFLDCPDTRTDKASHVMVASSRVAIGAGCSGVAAACDPVRIMIVPDLRAAASVHPNGRCARRGCAGLFALADQAATGDASASARPTRREPAVKRRSLPA